MCIRDRATPVEDVETLLPPAEPKQPEIPTQLGEINLQEKEVRKSETNGDTKMDRMMEMLLQMSQDLKEDIKSTKEGLRKDIEENGKKMEEKMGEKLEELREDKLVLSITCLLYTSRCV